MKKSLIISIGVTLLFSSCASIFISKKQTIVFKTGSSDAEVYLGNDVIGEGNSFSSKIDKRYGTQQLLIKRKGYKDQYAAIVKTHRPAAFWFAFPLNIFTIYPGFILDLQTAKNTAFDKNIDLYCDSNKLVKRGESDKYLNISDVKLDLKNIKTDYNIYEVNFDPKNLEKSIEIAQLKQDDNAQKAEKKKEKRKSTKEKAEINYELKIENTKFGYNVFQTLRKTGFIDTINKVFQDNNNTLILEARIKKINDFYVNAKFGRLYKSKLFITWYIKNMYDEIMDSVVTTEMSGEFDEGRWWVEPEKWALMLGDAVDVSYLKLHENPKISQYLKVESDFKLKDSLLTIKTPSAKVTDKESASDACVTIKLKEGGKDVGHGSGFIISEDGYIITNHHVVAGKYQGKYCDLTVVTSEGEEMPAKVIRTNKYRDIALIKVDSKFIKGFVVSNTKSFRKMQDIYTIGAPKSIELGQSISVGLISNERKTGNTHLLQLSMSVNGGNSGGPLFDATGALHGVIVSKLVGTNVEGVGFAIPGYLIADYLNINFN